LTKGIDEYSVYDIFALQIAFDKATASQEDLITLCSKTFGKASAMPYFFHLFNINSLDKVNNFNAFKLLSTIINSPSSNKALGHKESVRLLEALIFRTFFGRVN
jgi:hypothetical protein